MLDSVLVGNNQNSALRKEVFINTISKSKLSQTLTEYMFFIAAIYVFTQDCFALLSVTSHHKLKIM